MLDRISISEGQICTKPSSRAEFSPGKHCVTFDLEQSKVIFKGSNKCVMQNVSHLIWTQYPWTI